MSMNREKLVGYTINLRSLWTLNISKLPDWIWWTDCIYEVTNLITNKSYVGKASEFYGRLVSNNLSHLSGYKDYCINGGSKILYKSINKYGSRSFSVSIIDEYDLNDDYSISDLERYWIDKEQSHITRFGYNMTWGGEDNNMNSESVIKAKLRKYNGDIMGMCHTKEIYEARAKKYNGDCMGHCNTSEVKARALETNRRNHGGVLAIHTKNGRLIQSQSHIITIINRYLDKLRHQSIKLTPINYFNIIGTRDRDAITHIDNVCNHIYSNPSILDHDDWTSDMDLIFKWFDKYSSWDEILNIIKLNKLSPDQ